MSCYASMLEIEIVLMLHISNNMTFKPPPYVSKSVLQSTVELRYVWTQIRLHMVTRPLSLLEKVWTDCHIR